MILEAIKKYFEEYKSPRYRDSNAFYASQALQCRRDSVWARLGIPETDPTDIHGRIRMLIGSAVEHELISEVFSKLPLFGYVSLASSSQIPVGYINGEVEVHGYLDALVARQEGTELKDREVVEIKTVSGLGADFLYSDLKPSDSYIVQLGIYLKDLSKKAGITLGSLLYIPLSNDRIGDMLQIACRYEAATNEIVAYRALSLTGIDRQLDYRWSLDGVDEKFQEVLKHVKHKTIPPPDYQYKYPLTEELLESLSDARLRKAINGELVIGDFMPKYSRYKTLQLQTDGVTPQYSPEEIAVLRAHYKKRHPKSKI